MTSKILDKILSKPREFENSYEAFTYTKNSFTDNSVGWVCPKCNSCYAPLMLECVRCNTQILRKHDEK
jgi:uncharacterized OB-fold protein